MKALSIRQPWPWLILNGYKPIENRTRGTHYRGRFFMHASKGMTVVEYEYAVGFAHSIDASIMIPKFHDLPRGGIIGEAEIIDCVTQSDSPWFTGPYGFVLANVKPLPFVPCKGALGFFNVEQSVIDQLPPFMSRVTTASPPATPPQSEEQPRDKVAKTA